MSEPEAPPPLVVRVLARSLVVAAVATVAGYFAVAVVRGSAAWGWADDRLDALRYGSFWFLLGLAAGPAALPELVSRRPVGWGRAFALGLASAVVGFLALLAADVQHVYMVTALAKGAPSGVAAVAEAWKVLTRWGVFALWLGLNAVPFVPLTVVRLREFPLRVQALGVVAATYVLALPIALALAKATPIVPILANDAPVLLLTPVLPRLAGLADRLAVWLERRRRPAE